MEDINLICSRQEKLVDINMACSGCINKGVNVDGQNFSYSTEDQNNLAMLAIKCQKPDVTVVPYHADGQTCTKYATEFILSLIEKEQYNLLHHQTYANQLKQYVMSLATAEEIQAVKYGQELTGEYLATYTEMMKCGLEEE